MQTANLTEKKGKRHIEREITERNKRIKEKSGFEV